MGAHCGAARRRPTARAATPHQPAKRTSEHVSSTKWFPAMRMKPCCVGEGEWKPKEEVGSRE